MSLDELLPLVDEQGTVIGQATRSAVHKNRELLHPVVHCLVESRDRRLLLQQRSLLKDIQPGRWDTSVGGHVSLGETIESSVVREIAEELGLVVTLAQLKPLYRYVMRSEVETELVYTYWLTSDGPFRLESGEATALRFFTLTEIREQLGTGFFTPNFEDEFARFLAVRDTLT